LAGCDTESELFKERDAKKGGDRGVSSVGKAKKGPKENHHNFITEKKTSSQREKKRSNGPNDKFGSKREKN